MGSWALLALAMACCAAFLYAPGYLGLRALRVSRVASLVLAPVLSVLLIAGLCIVCGFADITCSWATVLVPVLLACAAAWGLSRLVCRRRGTRADLLFEEMGSRDDWLLLAAYVGVNLLITCVFFLGNIGSPEAFAQEFDNVHHLGTVRSMAESGYWSSMSNTLYMEVSDPLKDPFISYASFYPSAWHDMCALIMSLTGASVACSAVALNAVLMGVVFPASMFLLFRMIFGRAKLLVLGGAACVLALDSFPWKFLVWGVLSPNLMSMCVLPAIMAAFMAAFRAFPRKAPVAVGACLFVMGVASLALMQPSSVFTAIVFLAPFCVHHIAHRARACGKSRAFAYGMAVGFAVLCVVAWLVMARLPMFASLLEYEWSVYVTPLTAATSVLILMVFQTPAQLVFAAFMFAGIIYILARKRELAWLLVTFALFYFIYVVGTSTLGPFRQLVAGFWFTDPARLAANLALSVMPLAAVGIFAVARLVHSMVVKAAKGRGAAFARAVTAACVAVLVGVNFIPYYEDLGEGKSFAMPFGSIAHNIRQSFGDQERSNYSAAEQRFVERAMEVIPPDALVLNEPNDGSAFAYCADGLNAYSRYLQGYDAVWEKPESVLLRTTLDEIATNELVAEAAHAVGAEYVLQLDQRGDLWTGKRFYDYRESDWYGIHAVSEDTPGFELVLSEGDMRLYKIII